MKALTRACIHSGSFRPSAMCDSSPFSFSKSSTEFKSATVTRSISLDELEGSDINSAIFLC